MWHEIMQISRKYSGLCVYCGEAENIRYILFECSTIKNIWSVVSNCMKINILLKQLLYLVFNLASITMFCKIRLFVL